MDSLIEFGSRLFKNKRANVPEHIEVRPETSFLRDATPEQANGFFKIIGQGVKDELTKRGLPLKYYSFRGTDDHFAVVFAGKVLQFNMKEDYEKDKPTADIYLSFLDEKDLPLPGQKTISPGAYHSVEQEIGENTGKFLRFAAELLQKTDLNCQIELAPSTKRRERIYQTFITKINRPNIKVEHAIVDDLKHPK